MSCTILISMPQRSSMRPWILVMAICLVGCSFVSVRSVGAHGPARCTSQGIEPTIDLIVGATAAAITIASALTIDQLSDVQTAGIVLGPMIAIPYSISGLLGRRWIRQCRDAREPRLAGAVEAAPKAQTDEYLTILIR